MKQLLNVFRAIAVVSNMQGEAIRRRYRKLEYLSYKNFIDDRPFRRIESLLE